jgi:hypothetical protein
MNAPLIGTVPHFAAPNIKICLLPSGAVSKRFSGNSAHATIRVDVPRTALVQIAGEAETSPINKDSLFFEQDSIPGGGRSGIFESESPEVKLPLANAVHQLDA